MRRIAVLALPCALVLANSASAYAMGRKLDLRQIEGKYALVSDQSDPQCAREIAVHFDSAHAELDSESFQFSRIDQGSQVLNHTTGSDGNPVLVTEETKLGSDTLTQIIEASETDSDGQRSEVSAVKNILQYRGGLLVKYTSMDGVVSAQGLCTYVSSANSSMTPEGLADFDETAYFEGAKHEGPEWLYHPGFRAVLGSIQDQSFIFIESRADGLIFRSCEVGAGNGDDVIAGNQMPNACAPILNNDTVAIPPNLLLDQTLGLKRVLLTATKVVASGAVIGLTNMSWGLATSGAAMLNSVMPTDPIQDIKDYTQAKNVIDQMLKYGGMSEKKQDNSIVTELLDEPYDDIKAGVLSELTGIIKQMNKSDVTLDLRRKLTYHALVNKRYAAMLGIKKSGDVPLP